MRTEGLFTDMDLHTQLSPLLQAVKFKDFVAVLYLEEKEPEKKGKKGHKKDSKKGRKG